MKYSFKVKSEIVNSSAFSKLEDEMILFLASHNVDPDAYGDEEDGDQTTITFSLSNHIVRSARFKEICESMKTCQGDVEQLTPKVDYPGIVLSALRLMSVKYEEQVETLIRTFYDAIVEARIKGDIRVDWNELFSNIDRNYPDEVLKLCALLGIEFDEQMKNLIKSILNAGMRMHLNRYRVLSPQQSLREISEPLDSPRFPEQQRCKEAIEKIYHLPFHLVRLNLDHSFDIGAYNEELKIGVEYYGKQHYQYTPTFHRSIEDFHKQSQRDKLKFDACERNGIRLIIVPYTCPPHLVENFIITKLGLNRASK